MIYMYWPFLWPLSGQAIILIIAIKYTKWTNIFEKFYSNVKEIDQTMYSVKLMANTIFIYFINKSDMC